MSKKVKGVIYFVLGFLISVGASYFYSYVKILFDFDVALVFEKILIVVLIIPLIVGAALCLKAFEDSNK